MAWHNEGVTVGGEHEVTHVQPDEKICIYIYMFYLSAFTIQIIQMKVNKHMDGDEENHPEIQHIFLDIFPK